MDLLLMMAIGSMAMLAGFLGCFLPVLPGPAIAYAALSSCTPGGISHACRIRHEGDDVCLNYQKLKPLRGR